MACAAGLLRDAIPPLTLAHRYGVGFLVALLNHAKAASHATIIAMAGEAEDADDVGSVSSYRSSVSAVSAVQASVASTAESAAHCSISAVHRAACAGLRAYLSAATALLGAADAFLERAGVQHGTSARLALGRDASRALRQAGQLAASLALPSDFSFEDLVTALRALALLQQATLRIPSPTDVPWRQSAGERDELATYLRFALAAYGASGVRLIRMIKPLLRPSGTGAKICVWDAGGGGAGQRGRDTARGQAREQLDAHPGVQPAGLEWRGEAREQGWSALDGVGKATGAGGLGAAGGDGRFGMGGVAGGRAADVLAFERLAGIDASRDIILQQLRSEAFRPGYVLCLCRRHRAVVLTLRGTCHPLDFLTDLAAEPAPFEALGQFGHAHRGMLEGALRLSSELREPVRSALASQPGFGLVLTGHSLGGGLASLLALLWGPRIDAGAVAGADVRRVRCFAYGPAATLTLPLAQAAKGFVTSVVNANDWIPRLSLASVTNLRSALLALHSEDGLADRIIRRFGDEATGTFAGARLGGASAPPFVGWGEEDVRWAHNILQWLRGTDAYANTGGGGAEYVEELLPAGRILWAPPEGMLPAVDTPGTGSWAAPGAARGDVSPSAAGAALSPSALVIPGGGIVGSVAAQPGVGPPASPHQPQRSPTQEWGNGAWWARGRSSLGGGTGATGGCRGSPTPFLGAPGADLDRTSCHAVAHACSPPPPADRFAPAVPAQTLPRSPSAPGLVECANASHFNELQLGFANVWAHGPQAYAEALRASLHI